eukprot:TRINITY_DN5068_c0_g3_i2.p1 TRINITY_DN5068_c0_g3~~TRINITY_DN5068_c0_g3_i2.p1  ORF type:complete len:177 (+),score=62.63 TRINITY_DN5068_c0_g3_i2:60-533(+)
MSASAAYRWEPVRASAKTLYVRVESSPEVALTLPISAAGYTTEVTSIKNVFGTDEKGAAAVGALLATGKFGAGALALPRKVVRVQQRRTFFRFWRDNVDVVVTENSTEQWPPLDFVVCVRTAEGDWKVTTVSSDWLTVPKYESKVMMAMHHRSSGVT